MNLQVDTQVHGGNSEISEFLCRKIPMLFCLFHAFLIIIVQKPNTLRPRGFKLCEPFSSY